MAVDKIFINTTGIGEILQWNQSKQHNTEDDLIIETQDIGAHGVTIFAAREGMDMHQI